MVLYLLKYLEFLGETFGEYKLHIEDAKYAIKENSEGVGRALKTQLFCVCLFVCPELIGKTTSPRKLKICIQG